MLVLDKIKKYAEDPIIKYKKAVIANDESLTYRQLNEYSDSLAVYLQDKLKDNKKPIVVYGHKSVYMLVCFLACVKSGRAYVPEDISVPLVRVGQIIGAVESPVILSTEKLDIQLGNIITLDEIKTICLSKGCAEQLQHVKSEDVYYTIFTSGSTGTPKGVQITYECLNNFIEWGLTLGGVDKKGKVFLNQAPFSFDLSVMDLYLCLASGGTLFTLDKAAQGDYRRLFEMLRGSNANIWVSTPTFVEVCLADKQFSRALMHDMELFLFCGETLENSTVEKLHKRFPDAVVVNTYGPTESTVAVTETVVTSEMNYTENPLPVGRPKPGTYIRIRKNDGTWAHEGERGEIVIIGNTVSVGYFKNSTKSKMAFYTEAIDGEAYRAYRTGDEGYMSKGQLYYCGRIDLQVKLHGYRIEIGDIENNLLKLPNVSGAVVVPNYKDGKAISLSAFLSGLGVPEDSSRKAREYRIKLRGLVPDYMVPKNIYFVDKIPMTPNGKADRKSLSGMVK